MFPGCYVDNNGRVRTGPVVPQEKYDQLHFAAGNAYEYLAGEWDHEDDLVHDAHCLVCDLKKALKN